MSERVPSIWKRLIPNSIANNPTHRYREMYQPVASDGTTDDTRRLVMDNAAIDIDLQAGNSPSSNTDSLSDHEDSIKSIDNMPFHAKLIIDNGDQTQLNRDKKILNNEPSKQNSTGFDMSLIIVGAIAFVGDSSRGVLFPVLYSLCKRVGDPAQHFGYIVGAFSFGRLVATPLLGYICDRIRHRTPLTVCSLIICIGAVLWANVYIFDNIWMLYLSQLLLGIGSGTLGITRSYVVERTESKRRTEFLGILTALQYAGFTMTPVLGSSLSTLGSNYSDYLKFALPAYLMAFLAVVCFVGLVTRFQNIDSSQEAPSKPTDLAPSNAVNNANSVNFLIVSMILLNVTSKGSIAVFETVGAAVLIDEYGFSIFLVGLLISIAGSIGTTQLLLFKAFWARRFSDVQLMLGGLGVMIFAELVLLSYGSNPSLTRYVIGVLIMYGIGYPIGHTAVLGAFSKIQKSGPQAALLSWFATAGSVARVVLPICSNYIENVIENGPFCLVLLLVSISYLFIVLLKPLIEFFTNDSEAVNGRDELPNIWRDRSSLDWIQIVAMIALSSFSIFALICLAPGGEGI